MFFKSEKRTYPEVVYARTNAEFLNQRFGTNYRAWMKSRWEYDADTWVWMVRFDGKERAGWINYIINANEVCEEYIGAGEPTYMSDGKKSRIVVSVEESRGARRYRILGKFKLDEEKSTRGHHVLIKINDFV